MSHPPLPQQAVIAVVGTGAMGACIAQIAAAAGHPVKLLDARPDAAARAIAGIRAQFAKLAEKGKLTAAAAEAAGARLIAVDQLADLADAALVGWSSKPSSPPAASSARTPRRSRSPPSAPP